MPIITLTTDFGTKDPYLSAVKGKIHSKIKDITIVDISNNIKPFNLTEAAYILKNAYSFFPKGTIHIIGVNPEKNISKGYLITLLNGHYFISANNGIISLLLKHNESYETMIAVQSYENTNFPTLDLFTETACELALGKSISSFGTIMESPIELGLLNPRVNNDGSQLNGNIIYIDNYGNIVTNITKELFHQYRNDRAFEIVARTYTFKKIYSSYDEFVQNKAASGIVNIEGERLALFNSAGYLQIAIYKGSKFKGGTAFSLLGLYPESTTITVNFK